MNQKNTTIDANDDENISQPQIMCENRINLENKISFSFTVCYTQSSYKNPILIDRLKKFMYRYVSSTKWENPIQKLHILFGCLSVLILNLIPLRSLICFLPHKIHYSLNHFPVCNFSSTYSSLTI